MLTGNTFCVRVELILLSHICPVSTPTKVLYSTGDVERFKITGIHKHHLECKWAG
jgi:hypothetical protein